MSFKYTDSIQRPGARAQEFGKGPFTYYVRREGEDLIFAILHTSAYARGVSAKSTF